MKLSFRQIEPFVKSPDPKARVILVYGPDAGLMKERANIIGKTQVPDLSDPFNVVVLSSDIIAEDPARLIDEANAISMMGGNRLIKIEDATDKISTTLKTYLENASAETLIILEGGDLGPRSPLRKLCESAKNAAALPCYIESEQDLTRFINDTMRAHNIQIDRDAAAWLAINISGDRMKARSELDKIVTYKINDPSPVSLTDVQNCCGEAGATTLDDLIYATASRNTKKAMECYNTLAEEGTNFVVILRSLQGHFRKLHLTQSHMAAGQSMEIAIKNIRPPLFFKVKPLFQRQLSDWHMNTVEKILERLTSLEADCKKTGAPTETLCAQAILAISKSR